MFGAEEDYIGEDPNIPGKPISLWIDTTPQTKYPIPRIENIDVDVVVIGGGIAGITTAYLLKEAGKTVALVESRRIADDVTGHTTAKVTSQHGIIYKDLIENFGLEKATLYAKANESAIKLMEVIIKENNIKCDFERTPFYIYTEYPAYLKDIKDEVEASKQVGLKVEYTEETELPFSVIGALKVENQAQFHPRKYLLALAEMIPGENSFIFENTRAFDIEEAERVVVKTDKGDIACSKVVVATHYPFFDKGSYFTKLYPNRSYVISAKIDGKVPKGMYYSIEKDNYHAVRSQITKEGFVLIINGEEHKAGQAENTEDYYNRLVKYAEGNFRIKEVVHHWSTQDNKTPDGMPYIGRMPKTENVYFQTGFGGWGMTSGTVAAIVVTEQILGKKNPWEELFDPERKSPVKAKASSYISENLNVAGQFMKKAVSRESFEFVTDITEGEGRVSEYGGKKVAVFKDEKGEIHMVSPTCTHLGCQVGWNKAEKTWDCPCHGSRYTPEGKVIHGPAVHDLKNEDSRLEEHKEQ